MLVLRYSDSYGYVDGEIKIVTVHSRLLDYITLNTDLTLYSSNCTAIQNDMKLDFGRFTQEVST